MYDTRIIEDRIQEFNKAAFEEGHAGRTSNRRVYLGGLNILQDICKSIKAINSLEVDAAARGYISDKYLEVRDAIVDTILDALNS